jgi:hypothetical protein
MVWPIPFAFCLTFLLPFCYNPWAITPDVESAFFVDQARGRGAADKPD